MWAMDGIGEMIGIERLNPPMPQLNWKSSPWLIWWCINGRSSIYICWGIVGRIRSRVWGRRRWLLGRSKIRCRCSQPSSRPLRGGFSVLILNSALMWWWILTVFALTIEGRTEWFPPLRNTSLYHSFIIAGCPGAICMGWRCPIRRGIRMVTAAASWNPTVARHISS